MGSACSGPPDDAAAGGLSARSNRYGAGAGPGDGARRGKSEEPVGDKPAEKPSSGEPGMLPLTQDVITDVKAFHTKDPGPPGAHVRRWVEQIVEPPAGDVNFDPWQRHLLAMRSAEARLASLDCGA